MRRKLENVKPLCVFYFQQSELLKGINFLIFVFLSSKLPYSVCGERAPAPPFCLTENCLKGLGRNWGERCFPHIQFCCCMVAQPLPKLPRCECNVWEELHQVYRASSHNKAVVLLVFMSRHHSWRPKAKGMTLDVPSVTADRDPSEKRTEGTTILLCRRSVVPQRTHWKDRVYLGHYWVTMLCSYSGMRYQTAQTISLFSKIGGSKVISSGGIYMHICKLAM